MFNVRCCLVTGVWFSISKNGVITLQESILHKLGVFYITVGAADKGTPPLSSEKRLYIKVEDVNDDQPTFVRPARDNEVVYVMEVSVVRQRTEWLSIW